MGPHLPTENTLCKISSLVASGLIVVTSKWQKIMMRVRKSKETGIKTEVKTESQNAATTVEICSEIDEYEREVLRGACYS